MQRAFDDGADDDSVRKMSLLMGAVCVGGEESPFRVVDRERLAIVIPANDVLFVMQSVAQTSIHSLTAKPRVQVSWERSVSSNG